MKKIVALAKAMTAAQDRVFIDYLNTKGAGYWHWIDGAWLLNFPSNDVTCEAVRVALDAACPDNRTLVFEVDVKRDWNGRGPEGANEGKNTYFSWVIANWIGK
jgi:hypothetical protein